MRHLVLPLLTLALALPALAVDGVLEINQTCAVNTGCFAGDAAGFPVTLPLLTGRSYRLTSDLDVGDANSSGLFLGSPHISIDFNGFSLTNTALVAGTGSGITATLSGILVPYATIKNGVIRKWGSRGIDLGSAEGVRVENMTVEGTSGGAIEVGDDAQILSNRVSNNGGSSSSGIVAGANSLISQNVVSGSGQAGIAGGGGCTISANTVSGSGSTGIAAGDSSTVSGNTAYQNGLDGISAIDGATVSGNTANQNGRHGIFAGGGSTVQSNTVRLNGFYGLNLVGSAGYRENVITGTVTATTGTVLSGVNAGGNVCNGSLTCPWASSSSENPRLPRGDATVLA